MQADNLDFFKKIIFIIPSTRKLLAFNLLQSLIYGTITHLIVKSFTQIAMGELAIISVILFIYLLPALIYAKTLQIVFDIFRKNWSLLLASVNQSILFLFTLIMLATDTVSNAWSILWATLITIYMVNVLVLTLIMGKNRIKLTMTTGSLHSLLVLLSFHIFLGREMQIPWEVYALNLGFLAVAGIAVISLMLVMEYLMTSNISNISAFNLTSSLLRRENQKLDAGYVSEVEVQNLQIMNSSKLSLAAPWVHPGPIAGIGGGDITSRFIEKLNSNGDKGFFLHMPSNHEEDLVNPEDQMKILDAIGKPEMKDRASKLVKRNIGYGELYGRKIGDKKVVFMNIHDYDDYEVAIFKEAIDLEKTLLVDMHEEKPGERKVMYYGTSIAEKLREEILDFVDEIKKLDTYNYRSGFTVRTGKNPYICLVEEVEDQKTATIGFEYNGIPEEADKLRQQIKDKYDEVLFFSTDAHSSIEDLAEKTSFQHEEIEKSLEEADTHLESSSIGISMARTGKIDLIKEDYAGLIFSINIIVRILSLSLIFIYILLLLWVL